MLAARLVSSLAIRVKLLLYGVDELLDSQRTVVNDVDRVIPNIRRKLQRNSSQSLIDSMTPQHVQQTVYRSDLFGKRPVLLFFLRCLSKSETCLPSYRSPLFAAV